MLPLRRTLPLDVVLRDKIVAKYTGGQQPFNVLNAEFKKLDPERAGTISIDRFGEQPRDRAVGLPPPPPPLPPPLPPPENQPTPLGRIRRGSTAPGKQQQPRGSPLQLVQSVSVGADLESDAEPFSSALLCGGGGFQDRSSNCSST